ncbi:MAG: M28 family peptidase, partial [Acidobacteriota bacterium]
MPSNRPSRNAARWTTGIAVPLLLVALPAAGHQDPAPQPVETEAATQPSVETPNPYRYWPADVAAEQAELEAFLDAVPSPERLADWHERFSSEPHVAGYPGDLRLIDKMADYLRSFDLDVEVHQFTTLLAKPVSARLEIVASPELDADALVFGPAAELPLALPVKERVIDEDPFTNHPDLLIGWNAYSGSGDVTAKVVYANFGRKEDFERLRALGVEVEGKIVIARYGGNFRGFKAKFAEEAGAVGLVMYTDPGDAGYGVGAVYPEGGWANSSYIQRGSVKALPYPGDPLTPGVEATADVERLDVDSVGLPTIPVQPVGWNAAFEILRRMDGGTVPRDWRGGLPMAYRLEGGEELEIRLAVEQTRELVETANVLGTLRGAVHPDEIIVVGGHHDAWSFGAGDPNAGTILIFEAARSFAAALAQEGERPDRTIVFANWGAEEYGIIGSTEWVEGRRELLSKAVAYINLDGSAMGTTFRSSASPSLKTLITEIARDVPQAHDETVPVYTHWLGERDVPPFGNLGGGSDHVGFYCHLGIPSVSLAAGGSPGVSYHSNYENLTWYRQVVGDDYAGARMLTRMVNRFVSRLANAPLLPLDPSRYGTDARRHLAALGERAEQRGVEIDLDALEAAATAHAERAERIWSDLTAAVADGRLADDELASVNAVVLGLERRWLHEPGLPNRPWFKNLFAATDPDSGYAAWMLPALRWVVEREATDRWNEIHGVYLDAFRRLDAALDELE